MNAILNSQDIVSGGTFTAAAGTNRLIVAIGVVRKDTGTPTWSATFGGVAMTLDAQSPYLADDKLLVFSLREASIPSGSQALVSTPSGGTALDNISGTIYTLQGRSQSSPVDSGFTNSGTATSVSSITTASITNAAHSCLLTAVRETNQDALTTPSGWTLRQNYVTSALSLYDKDDAAAASQAYTWGGSSANDWIWLTVAYAVAAGVTLTQIEGAGMRGTMRGTMRGMR